MMEWTPTTLGEMVNRVSQEYAGKEAIVCEDDRISYEELRDHVDRVARAFLALGIRKDDKVSIWLYNCPDWIFVQLALGKIGAILVPINTRFKLKELEYALLQVFLGCFLVGSSRVDLQACKLEYSIVSPK